VADSIIRVATQIADGKVHDPASCWPYLRRAMHNQWLNTVVRNARSIAVEDLPDSGTASAESIYLRESNAAELRRCASDMPPKWATAFKGYYFDGKPPAEVAEEMGISRIYVNQLLCRARERFVENCTRHHIRPPSSP
jgi:RNA polymerase sigma factor (sigma-70 family)